MTTQTNETQAEQTIVSPGDFYKDDKVQAAAQEPAA